MVSALADRPLRGFRLAEGKKEAGLNVRGIMLSINTQRSGIDPDALLVPPLMAALSAMMAHGQRVFYTTPVKALSNQKLRDFR